MKKVLAEGKFTNYVERDGWEYIERKNNTPVVSIIAHNKNNLILVRQFRKPVNKFVIELPAGLIDKDESVEKAVLRELKEETGYNGIVKSIIPPTAKSPGITDEMTHIVFVECTSKEQQNLQDEEKIEVIEVDILDNESITKFMQRAIDVGDIFSTTLALFFSTIVASNAIKKYYEEDLEHEKN